MMKLYRSFVIGTLTVPNLTQPSKLEVMYTKREVELMKLCISTKCYNVFHTRKCLKSFHTILEHLPIMSGPDFSFQSQ
jgi:hypothetical protein